MPPASWWPRTPSIRTRRATTGMAPLQSSPRWRRGTSVELVAIGNGTASRETDKLVADLIKRHPETD